MLIFEHKKTALEQYEANRGQYHSGNQGTQGAAWQKSRDFRQPWSGEDTA